MSDHPTGADDDVTTGPGSANGLKYYGR